MLCSRGLLRPLSAVGAAAWAALPTLRPISSAVARACAEETGYRPSSDPRATPLKLPAAATVASHLSASPHLYISAGAAGDDAVEQHHQEEVAEEEAEEWALGQREHHEHEGFEALPWPPLPAAGAPTGGAHHNSTPHNGSTNNGTRPVRFYSGQAGGGGDTAAGGEAEGAAPAVPAWERTEVLWEAEEPRPGSWRQGGGEERDPFQGGWAARASACGTVPLGTHRGAAAWSGCMGRAAGVCVDDSRCFKSSSVHWTSPAQPAPHMHAS